MDRCSMLTGRRLVDCLSTQQPTPVPGRPRVKQGSVTQIGFNEEV
jgi:hypothetical protein